MQSQVWKSNAVIGVVKPTGMLANDLVEFVKRILTHHRQLADGLTADGHSTTDKKRKRSRREDELMTLPVLADIPLLPSTYTEPQADDKDVTKYKKKRTFWPYRDLKVGQGGTLDPLAEGVMVIGIGSGTKKLGQFMNGDVCRKSYTVTM